MRHANTRTLARFTLCAAFCVGAGLSGSTYAGSTKGVPHKLVGWAALDQAERTPGPTSGQFIGPSLGVVPPFVNTQPIPGWSGLLNNGDGTFTALPDNGFGAKGNSGDYVLGIYHVTPNFKKRCAW